MKSHNPWLILLKVEYHRKITIIKLKKYNNCKIQSISFLEIYIKIIGISLLEGKLPTDRMKSKKYAHTGENVDEKVSPSGAKGLMPGTSPAISSAIEWVETAPHGGKPGRGWRLPRRVDWKPLMKLIEKNYKEFNSQGAISPYGGFSLNKCSEQPSNSF